ncbi:TrbI/VirB10 family protein [Sphingomonas mali]|uniref:TrbI/VirB10 family protein n=1 Tax=Sphingomonas mali TaxID=40682 RepID=UPI0009FBC689
MTCCGCRGATRQTDRPFSDIRRSIGHGWAVHVASKPQSQKRRRASLVDFHTWALLKGVVLSSVLGVGSELQFSGNGDLVTALREAAEQNVSRAGDRLTARNLDIQPTITIRPGAPVRLLVDRDLVLAPWREG